ncbi:MAG: hypothetical protein IIX84_05750, partial [Oscillospiraceae bacterium]|nr:hypothetical protein [Oscillospiraceae bacterium]
DDFFELNMLAEMYNTAKKDGSDTVICGNYVYNDTKKQKTPPPKTRPIFPRSALTSDFTSSLPPAL